MLIAIDDIHDGTAVINTAMIEAINYDEEEECYTIETPNYSYNITEEQLICIITSDVVTDTRVSNTRECSLYTREEVTELLSNKDIINCI